MNTEKQRQREINFPVRKRERETEQMVKETKEKLFLFYVTGANVIKKFQ